MSSTIENSQEELNQVANEILALTENLKQKTKNSMMIGERSILKGISVFEEVIKELNPDVINDGVISMIVSYVSIIMFKQEERMQRVDNKMHYGIQECYMILDIYNKTKKRELALNKTLNS